MLVFYGSCLPYLYLLALEHRANASVKGSTGEHGSNRVGQIQDLLKERRHILKRQEQREVKDEH